MQLSDLGASNGLPGKEILVHHRRTSWLQSRKIFDTRENSLKARASEIQSLGCLLSDPLYAFRPGQLCIEGIKLYRLSGLTPSEFVPAGTFVGFSRSLGKALRCFSGHCWRSFTPVGSVPGCLDMWPRFQRSALSGMLYRRCSCQLRRTLPGGGEKLAACRSDTGRTGQ